MTVENIGATSIEGTLWKWTNYWSGWQPRWLVLKDGVLSYFASEEDVGHSCKGSITLAAAEVSAHQSDPLRLDVVVPGEQHFYLKASTPHERQAWLQVLGTVKACVNSRNGDLLDGSALRKKYCELRIYCDLLMQQVHSIKSIVTESPVPDVQQLDETTALLSETCDTFIRSLEDCLQLTSNPSGRSVGSSSVQPYLSSSRKSPSDSGPKLHHSSSSKASGPTAASFRVGEIFTKPAVSCSGPPGMISPGRAAITRTSSDEMGPPSTSKENRSYPDVPVGVYANRTLIGSKGAVEPADDPAPVERQSHGKDSTEYPDPPAEITFFTMDPMTFCSLRLNEDGTLPTATFLDSCRHLVRIFDSLGSTTFSPVKMDLNGNIRKLTLKYEFDTESFATIQAMIGSEVAKETTDMPDSATDALLWLKRGIWFVRELLAAFNDGEKDMSNCTSLAYSKTLKAYHGWVVRGMFSMALSAVPTRYNFIISLSPSGADVASTQSFLAQVKSDTISYIAGIDRSLRSINNFYAKYRLDSSLNENGEVIPISD